MRKFAFVLLLAAAPIASAIVIRHDRATERYAAGTRFPAVGFLGRSVTCTLIAPRWLIGAAHTIEDHVDAVSKLTVVLADKTYMIDKIVIHPDRVHGAVDSAADLGLMRLATPVTDVEPVTLYTAEDEPGKVATIVGYGEIGNGLTGATGPRGTPHAAQNTIEATFENSLVFTFDRPPAGLDLEGIPGPGDSGCPAFIEQEGKLRLAGVGSFNTGSDADHTASHYGTLDGFARVSTRVAWIRKTIADDPPSTVPFYGPYSRTSRLPDTPAGRAATALVEAFNTGDTGRIAAFYRAFGRRRAEDEIVQAAASWKDLMEQYGRYETLGYRDSGPYVIAVFVKASKGDLGRAIIVTLDHEGEHRVQTMRMADAAEPAE